MKNDGVNNQSLQKREMGLTKVWILETKSTLNFLVVLTGGCELLSFPFFHRSA